MPFPHPSVSLVYIYKCNSEMWTNKLPAMTVRRVKERRVHMEEDAYICKRAWEEYCISRN